jgi:hypothetical protein
MAPDDLRRLRMAPNYPEPNRVADSAGAGENVMLEIRYYLKVTTEAGPATLYMCEVPRSPARLSFIHPISGKPTEVDIGSQAWHSGHHLVKDAVPATRVH